MSNIADYPRHKVCLVVEDERWFDKPIEDLADRSINSALYEYDPKLDPCEINLLATNDGTIQKLNKKFRNKNQPTNVLSWQAGDMTFPDSLDGDQVFRFLGDIAVSFDTLVLESSHFGLTLANHLSHLLVHSTLHLVGFTHYQKQDEKIMEGMETKILATMGIADPYGDNQMSN